SPEERARSFYKRAVAAGEVGRNRQMRDDLAAARAETLKDSLLKANILISTATAQADSGNLVRAIDYREQAIAILDRLNTKKGRIAASHAILASRRILIGDLDGAGDDLVRSRAILDRIAVRGRQSHAFLALPCATLLQAEGSVARRSGRYEDAEDKVRNSLILIENLIVEKTQPQSDLPVYPAKTTLKLAKMNGLQALANALVRQHRFAEAEIAARNGIQIAAASFGRNSIYMARAIDPMILVLTRTSRLTEALNLAAIAIDILEKLGVDQDGHRLNRARHRLAAVHVATDDWNSALSGFAAIAKAARGDNILLDRFYRYDLDRATALLQTGQVDDAAKITGPAARRLVVKLGAKSYESALALGLHAVALQRAGDTAAALELFRQSFAILSTRSRESSGTGSGHSGTRLRLINEGYMAALMQSGRREEAAEAFRVASFTGARKVQMALAQSAARAAIADPGLRDLVRSEQDAKKQISAFYGILSNALIDSKVVSGEVTRLRTAIDDLRGARAVLMEEIEQRFPDYAELINPKPADIASVRGFLAPDEAMVVTYVGAERIHIWAFPAKGVMAFSTFEKGRAGLRTAVERIRKSLTPQAQTLGDIPEFDVTRAHDLYAKLLQPVAAGWRGSENLFIVAHGPLGYLPFALLPTARTGIGPQREPLFVRYADVPWLIRNHSIAMLPSAHSLAALRRLPVRSGEQRQFAGFGDPLFGGDDDDRNTATGAPEQGNSGTPRQVAAVTTRGVKRRNPTSGRAVKLRSAPRTSELSSAGLEILPRLPETSDEIRNIAKTLQADPSRDVFIGRAATEGAVKSVDLSIYRILAFATHGLIPGDLDGLSQPAIALSSPKIVGGSDDGLLTMGEILGLKLNADWVVLSACNTGAGEGAGAEAVSGLGRAFFYAGTRALLVSNWPVETTSAMALTTDLFRRQFEDPALARAQALRQAILALMDGRGYVDPQTNSVVFSYAHPIFWAPFSLVGDGGAGRPGA
ncbi:MAG: CHAT domain-containing protein, partial [Rhodospirillaceae bacterium]|nr:CHAT domain-containing protein [Rhodospirillaceae bacterium]